MKIFAWFSIILVLASYIMLPIQDPDLGWHITVGRWILANFTVPSAEHWNRFALGEPWVAYSWSNEIIYALADKIAGVEGLFILKFIILLIFTTALFYFYGQLAKDYFFGGILGCLAVSASFNHITLRPQMLIWILQVVLIFILDEIDTKGLNRKRGFYLVLIMSFWANTHLSAVLGIMTVVLWLFRQDKLKLTLQATGLALLGTLVTPYFGKEWLIFFSKAEHPLQMNQISEFSPANILQYSTGFLVVTFVLLLLFLHFKPTIISFGKTMLSCLFVAMALMVVKFIPQAVIVMCACIAVAWRMAQSKDIQIAKFRDSVEAFRKLYNFMPLQGLTFFCLCLTTCNFYHNWKDPELFVAVPKPAVEFMVKHDLPHPIMSTFGAGGYLMYRYSDANGNLVHKVAIDGRTNVNPPEVWRAFNDALRFNQNWRDYFELVKPETILWNTESPLATFLVHEKEWCRVFQYATGKRGFSVFVKRQYFQEYSDLESDNCPRDDIS